MPKKKSYFLFGTECNPYKGQDCFIRSGNHVITAHDLPWKNTCWSAAMFFARLSLLLLKICLKNTVWHAAISVSSDMIRLMKKKRNVILQKVKVVPLNLQRKGGESGKKHLVRLRKSHFWNFFGRRFNLWCWNCQKLFIHPEETKHLFILELCYY